MRREWVVRRWHTLLAGLAFVPCYATYDAWRDGTLHELNPPTIAFFVAWEAVLWGLWRRRRMWLFGPPY